MMKLLSWLINKIDKPHVPKSDICQIINGEIYSPSHDESEYICTVEKEYSFYGDRWNDIIDIWYDGEAWDYIAVYNNRYIEKLTVKKVVEMLLDEGNRTGECKKWRDLAITKICGTDTMSYDEQEDCMYRVLFEEDDDE